MKPADYFNVARLLIVAALVYFLVTVCAKSDGAWLWPSVV